MPTCPTCGHELPAEAEFCGRCGQRLGDPGSAPGAVKDPIAGPLYDIRTRQWFKQAWRIFKLYPWGFLGFGLILLLAGAGLQRLTREVPVQGVLLSSLLGPLHAGLYLVTIRLLQGQPCRFEDFFAGFRFLAPLLIFGLITGFAARLGYFLPEDFLLRLLCRLGFLVFMLYFVFTPLLIVDRRLGWREAMELSYRTVQRRPGRVAVFLLWGFLIAASGLLALLVGSLVTVPLFFSAITIAYAEIFGLQSQEY